MAQQQRVILLIIYSAQYSAQTAVGTQVILYLTPPVRRYRYLGYRRYLNFEAWAGPQFFGRLPLYFVPVSLFYTVKQRGTIYFTVILFR